VARISREQRFDGERPVRDDHEVDPGAGNVDPRKLVGPCIDLGNDDALPECGGLDDGGRVLGIRPRVEVALRVGLLGANQRDLRAQVDEPARVKLDIGVNLAPISSLPSSSSWATRKL